MERTTSDERSERIDIDGRGQAVELRGRSAAKRIVDCYIGDKPMMITNGNAHDNITSSTTYSEREMGT